MSRKRKDEPLAGPLTEHVAGNGILNRRVFLERTLLAGAAGMSRSFPLAKAMDDALICLFQNGERVRPANGYPVRYRCSWSTPQRGSLLIAVTRRPDRPFD